MLADVEARRRLDVLEAQAKNTAEALAGLEKRVEEMDTHQAMHYHRILGNETSFGYEKPGLMDDTEHQRRGAMTDGL